MKILYICNTPYQILNVLNLVYHDRENRKRYKKILFIVNQFEDAKNLYERIRDANLFDDAYLLRKDEVILMPTALKRYKSILKYYFRPEEYLKKQLANYREVINYKNFDIVYASGISPVTSAIMKLNPYAEFILYEDGVGSYDGNIILKTGGSKFNLIFSKIFHVGAYVSHPTKLLVNNKKMCHSTAVPSEKIESLPELDSKFIDFCNSIFGISPNSVNIVYWLSQPVVKISGGLSARDLVYQCLYPYRKKVIVRMHPRDSDYEFYKDFVVDRGTDMWELSILNKNIDNLILIAGYSSAQINPKLIFDKEPTLIFVHSLNSMVSIKQKREANQRIEELRNVYRHPERIYNPQTLAEFKKVLIELLCD